ncbi:hypothetical protein LOH54_08290 [Sulfurimonas sp. HSL-3221]|uniref:hypothetical protein n=1 Tax=Sulfurimonadaceae TaxID=2771471 RepID=UPI001E2A9C31|nr:hypothetical protein [Sulfurimonas sp. HSL-3221]UFS61661.1 hypothetical protein LOH54_08290 [Sulfurimonas sp. HSL-3221]
MPEYSKASKARVPDETSEYSEKGRLRAAGAQIDRYRIILDKDNFQPEEPHWRRISKNTVSLFQVLIDQNLHELVMVLEHYPRYIEWVCEHFRYAYSYSENEASIDAASRLLELGEPFFTKQFVRNLVRKLPRLDAMELEALKTFAEMVSAQHGQWHPIVTNHYCDAIGESVDSRKLHPLQRLAITGKIANIARIETFEYDAEDRDAVLDIPYMN